MLELHNMKLEIYNFMLEINNFESLSEIFKAVKIWKINLSICYWEF